MIGLTARCSATDLGGVATAGSGSMSGCGTGWGLGGGSAVTSTVFVGAAPVGLGAAGEQPATGVQLGRAGGQLAGRVGWATVGDVRALVDEHDRDPVGGGLALLELGMDHDLRRARAEDGGRLVDGQLEPGVGVMRPRLL